ncbi:MAG: ankyrin repeat domain-containing protein [Gemmatimonadota bacterium]|nr:ankyrin repeat domain-containing protein [Gemmatimonadota bacterium]MDE2866400.1 ankyrin repeat domain-containing protein [Gemmatimonadota bacterium]
MGTTRHPRPPAVNIGALRASGLVSALLLALLLPAGVGHDSPVADAAMRGDAAAVRALIADGADVNVAQGDGMTALHWAASNRDPGLARMLVEAGADIGAGTRIGRYTPLHVAAQAGAGEVAEVLLGAGAEPDAAITVGGGARPLHLAAASGSERAVWALVAAGADVNAAEESWAQTPLIFAASKGRTEVVAALLDAGADPAIHTRVMDVTSRAVYDRIERAERNRRIREGQPWGPEVAAEVRRQHEEESRRRELAEAASAAEAETRMIEEPEPLSYGELVGGHGGLTALLHAVREGHAETALALIDGGADINQVSAGDGTSPILMATINGHYDLAMRFLELGADPTTASHAGATPLFAAINTHWAPKSRYPQQHIYMQQDHTYLEVMEKLLAAGADPNARLTRHLWFMSYNFDLLQIDAKGATPFWRAAYALDVEAMQLLVARGADPSMATERVPSRRFGRGGGEEVDHSGLPPVPVGGPAVYPIHAASGVGYGQGFAANAHRHVPDGWVPAVRYLVEELGADVNARDLEGFSPIHHAAARGDNELILYLVEQGADVTLVSRRGQTTVDMANGPVQRIQPFPETIALLESLGAVNNHNCVSC